MASNKIKHVVAGGLALAMTMSIGGCTKISNYESTAECIPAAQVSEQAVGLGYETAEVYEDSFVVEFQTEACVTYTLSRSLYWENPQDNYGEILVSAGDIVKKGDVLATFESNQDGEIQILERTLAVQEAQASLNEIVQTYDNLIATKQKSMESLTGYDYQIAGLQLELLEYEYALRMNEAEYRVSKQQEALDATLLEQGTKNLVAPFDGKISSVSRSFHEGTAVDTGEPILKISDLDSRVLAFKGSNFSSDITYLKQVMVKDPQTQEEYTGTIVSCPDVTDNINSEVIIKVDTELLDDKDDVDFEVTGYIFQKEKATLVDSRALKNELGSTYVYVLNENNARYKVYVTVGENRNDVAWIVDGLLPGQRVIIE